MKNYKNARAYSTLSLVILVYPATSLLFLFIADLLSLSYPEFLNIALLYGYYLTGLSPLCLIFSALGLIFYFRAQKESKSLNKRVLIISVINLLLSSALTFVFLKSRFFK